MYHSDSGVNGILRAFQLYWFAVDQNLAAVRLIHSVKHSHQGRFAGPVFSDQTIDLSSLQRQIHILQYVFMSICFYNTFCN